MKFASVKTKRGINQGKFNFTGEELAERDVRKSCAPTGFYTNHDTSYTGIVLRDKNGNCTYFDRTHSCVYAFDKDIWKHTMFTWQSTMTSLAVKLVD